MDSMDRMQQKDLVLNVNEYAYVLDQTKGNVVCWVGPSKTSLSNSDQLVSFNEQTKRFEPCNFKEAVKLFTTAPKGWYVVLKNPTKDGRHPSSGTSNNIPEGVQVGKKINIEGPVSFALYPGQMAKVIQGHILRSNQYIIVRVYDAEAASESNGEDADPYTPGQMMVIKGTEVAFYIPPTGFEIVKNNGSFVQDAVTLEKLEYCILKNEDGNKRYVQGPAVVFPEPTESFIKNNDGSFKFKAIELSKISGIYIKVIEDYEDGDKSFKAGDELFLTGKDQMIYYPRPEHAIIQYGDKIVHHAIAIPKGEGRYMMDRLSGEISSVIGPRMLLPDPRQQVIVKRKLSRKQCELWYPGNQEVLEYNGQLVDKSQAAMANISYSLISADTVGKYNAAEEAYRDTGRAKGLAAGDSFSRSMEYSKPRSITIDNKYEGVVKLDVWTGYAVNVISSNGDRRVVVGPQSVLLNYDETLEVLSLSTGKPKTTDVLLQTAFLRCENNNIGDIISLETSDYIPVDVKVSYLVDFDKDYIDDWFKVENYVKFLCDRIRSKLKCAVKKHTIAEFYGNSSTILRNAVLDITDGEETNGVFFPENGMLLKDVEILMVRMDRNIESMMEDYQRSIINNTLKLSTSEQSIGITRRLAEIRKEEAAIVHAADMNKLELNRQVKETAQTIEAVLNRLKEDEATKQKDAELELQQKDIKAKQVAREEYAARKQVDIDFEEKEQKLAIDREVATAEAIKSVMASISPDLVQAMKDRTNAELIGTLTENMSPYALAKNENVVEVTRNLLYGTPIDGALKDILGNS